MIRLVEPANPLDIADLLSLDRAPRKAIFTGRPLIALAFRHAALTRSAGFVDDDGRALACAGLYDHGGGDLEAWFLCRPSCAPRMLAILRVAHLTLAEIVESGGVEIRARVAVDWRPGARIATLLGFRRGRVIAGFEEWIMR